MKELFNAIRIKYSPILRPDVFNAAAGGRRPTKSEQEQRLSLGDHKLDTGQIVGYIFPEDTIFKSMSFQECRMRLSSKPPEVIHVSVDQIGFKNRFLCVPDGFPDNIVPILPVCHQKLIALQLHRYL